MLDKIKTLKLKGNVNHISNTLKKFKLDKNFRIILLSAERSSSGINLIEANNIIFVDVFDDNKEIAQAIERQAIGRAFRIGQTKEINVYKLIMRNTIEEKLIK